jgi:transposase InsO family protein
MTPRPKTSYHPFLLIACYLNCLPSDIAQHIPRSTRHGWLHKEQDTLFGYDWYQQNKHLFDTLKHVVSNKRLLQVNKALIRVLALQRFMQTYADRIKQNVFEINDTILNNLHKVNSVIGLRTTLKLLQLSYSSYLRLKKRGPCIASVLRLCRVRHPSQLLKKEVDIIIAYCTDVRYLHWPLASIYHQIRRDGAAAFTLSTFYKYAALLNLKRSIPAKRKKNHHVGIRASAPFHILHADSSVFKTVDKVKNYIYLVQDNFSRAILSFRVAKECKAQISFENLESVLQQYLIPAGIETCQFITDDGSENAGPINELISSTIHPSITHLIAQRDIEFSNSMIEAANKQLKYSFLYHRNIPDHEALVAYVQQAVHEYNNRPHHVLEGQTPFEVLNGSTFDKTADQKQIYLAKEVRLIENKRTKCCYYSF